MIIRFTTGTRRCRRVERTKGARVPKGGGRQITYTDRTPVSNLYVEMLDRMGVQADGFGESKSSKHQSYNGRLPGLV